MPQPVAKLYYGSTSVWSSVVRLTIVEKGYGADEIEFKLVNMVAGDNYKPEYLRINPFGTVPALVVPLEPSLAPGADEVKYKTLTDSKPIVEFLDKSRGPLSKSHTTSTAPRPMLTPATPSLLAVADRIIEIVREQPDITRLGLAARSEEALLAKAQTPMATTAAARVVGCKHLLSAEAEGEVPAKVLPALHARLATYGPAVSAYEAVRISPTERTSEQHATVGDYITASRSLWEDVDGLPKHLAALEREIVGPLCLGDQPSIADVYLAPWITRLVFLSQGNGTPAGIDAVPGVGPKVKAFWEAFIQRPSWIHVFGKGIF